MLSDKDILLQRELGNIVIDPFDERQLGNTSYDIRLGGTFWVPKQGYGVVRPRDIASVRDFFELRDELTWGDPFYIGPHGRALARTIEVVGARSCITTEVAARSSIGRLFLDIRAGSAGRGDVGYINQWTLELINPNDCWVALEVGMRIGQIFFHHVGEVNRPYQGKYGQGTFSPESMLPRLDLDWDSDLIQSRRGQPA